MLTVRNESFRTIDHVAVTVGLCGRLDTLQIGTGARFGHGNSRNNFALSHFRKKFFLLLMGHITIYVMGYNTGMDTIAKTGDVGIA